MKETINNKEQILKRAIRTNTYKTTKTNIAIAWKSTLKRISLLLWFLLSLPFTAIAMTPMTTTARVAAINKTSTICIVPIYLSI